MSTPPEQEQRASTLACHSGDFLTRAEELLARFTATGYASYFFYAALELRYGIEARLHEILGSSRSAHEQGSAIDAEYSATKLLKKLAATHPAATTSLQVRVNMDTDGRNYRFDPITPELASIHGKLGDLLHYNFFLVRTGRARMSGSHSIPRKIVEEKLSLLESGIAGLRKSVSSNILVTPALLVVINDFLANNASDPSEA
jgi:hypothetical protein